MSEIELQDAILRHALELQRLSAHEEAEAEAILRELIRDLERLANSRDLSRARKAELNAIIAEADKVIEGRYATIAGALDTHGLTLLVADRTVETLSLIGPGIVRPTAETLASLAKNVLIDGAPSSAWWEKQSEDLSFKFAAQVRQGVINGETNEQIVGRIVGRKVDGLFEPGIMEAPRRNARSLVHSSIMTAANDARMATYRTNARFIGGVRRVTALDGHVCVRCAAYGDQIDGWHLDGTPRGSTTMPMPPAMLHWNDRCVMSAFSKSEPLGGPAFGTRASKDGPVRANMTFNDFLKRQSPEFVDKMLGKERAALFRRGKITVRDLVSGTGRELTLDELR